MALRASPHLAVPSVRVVALGQRCATAAQAHSDRVVRELATPASGPSRPSSAALLGGAFGVVAMRRRRHKRTSLRSSPDAVWPISEEDRQTLKQVVIVHRHGTRFPTKPSGPGNLGWPVRAQFWESYKGHLTPLGAKTLTDTGAVLRKRYIGPGGLFERDEKVDGRAIAVYTSNVQRTLQSAWSFLLGLVPGASIFFAFRSERVFAQALKQAVGVPIYVEDATEGDDRLFHEWKLNKEAYKKWKKENLKKSVFFQEAKDSPEYMELLDRLYERLQEPKLAPGGDALDRLTAAKDVDTQVMIEESHNRPILPNEFGEELSEEEQEMLRRIGDELKRCWFGDANGEYSQSYGKQAAGYLAHKIWRHLDERARGLCHQRLVQFSCHDTTMCALAAHYGIELDKIGFGAFFTLELHEESDGTHCVKFYYNREPDSGAVSFQDLQSLVLPLGRERTLRKVQDCAVGNIALAELERHSRIDGLEETFEAFVKLLGRADLGPTRKDLQFLLRDDKHGWHTFDEWKELYRDAFETFDQNKDGMLCKTEMQDAFFAWYGVRGKITDLIFHLVDREPETDALSQEDVYLAMCALVGVRGSISSKTTGEGQTGLVPDAVLDEDPNARSAGGITKLMSASNAGDVNVLRALLGKGADVNAQDDYGWTALRYAVRKRAAEAVEVLIDGRADVNMASDSGRSPLMSAVANGSANIVQMLVESGADLEFRNGDGLTAHDIASRGGGMGSSVIRGLVDPKRLQTVPA
eukprot:s708_g7.t1